MRSVLVPLAISGELPPASHRVIDMSGGTMGTMWSVKAVVPPRGLSKIEDQLEKELDQVVAQMSHWEPESNLSQFNNAGAGSSQRVPDAFAKVLAYALWVREASGGAYDPCAGALVNLWGFGAKRRYDQPEFFVPSDQAIEALVARRDGDRIEFDPAQKRLLQPGGVQLDLSSVAKGFAVDQLARRLEAGGISHYLIEVGGELRGSGMKPDGQPWWVALEGVPGTHSGEVIVALHGLSVATSGDYRQHFRHNERRASHTLDPRTGYPIRNQVASVTVLHEECMAADALSTAMSVLGPEEGLAFAEQHQLAARFLLRAAGELTEITSSAFRAMLQ
ncbi:FAD:protein FMN transferase [Massilia cavernae]|uniref:FAD:protein FMN transferase n=1 Tax=Massilia cavernae TaxID=2320864 RepID=A0A418XG39_9BURK|nr:FAD:protein FMN transferase [Massilia cavernae]RJG11422.1 FAD:protein FMN transferase [Massilia cavernae]